MVRVFDGISRIARRKVLLVFYLLAIILPFTLDHFAETAENLPGVEGIWARPVLFYEQITGGVTLSGFRRPRAKIVRLVSFDPAREPAEITNDPCVGRAFEAKVLNTISKAHPALIVMDELFDADTCPQDDPGTAQLREAVASAARAGIPVVLGLDSLNREDQIQKGAAKTRFLDDDELILQPGLEFKRDSATEPRVLYGHVRLESDSRRIPLSWKTYASEADFDAGKPPVEMPTLAFQAAKLYDPSPAFQAKLYSLNARDEDPYTSFLSESEFVEYEALDLVCGAGATSSRDWKNCSASAYDELRGHIVLIGDRAGDDMQSSVLGVIPGYLLQANYIEGLLDGRVFFPVPWWIELIATIALLGAIESIFRLFPRRTAVGAVLVLGIAWLASYATAHELGWYLCLWTPALIALFGEVVSLLADRSRERASPAPS